MTPEFLAAVKAGRIEGLTYEDDSMHGELIWVGTEPCFLRGGMHKSDRSVFCDHLRDWFTAKGWKWEMSATYLTLELKGPPKHTPSHFMKKNELDRHVAAAMHVLACEEGAK